MKPHISASQMEMYARCPEAYRRRYVEGEKIPPGMAAHIGSGVHAGAEVNFRQKVESREDLPVSDIVDAAVQGFKTRVQVDGYMLDEDEKSIGHRTVIADATDLTADLARLHAKTQAVSYQPVECERTTLIVLPDASRDLITVTDLRDDGGRVVDFKTASRAPSQDDCDSSLQLTAYAAAFAVDNGGRYPAEVRLDVLTKTKTPARKMFSAQRTIDDIESLAHRIDATVRAIDAGIFPPTSPANWACSAKWCGYFQTCRFASKRLK